ncbi:MAG: SDR family oxidoreductase [Dehalococcoidia bacterium]|jgi:NAD(P)-dependent dehydrogenase (short-subunit alcohol dehydrogenase family)|nr:SDR family oxidoreductase [Dehalococcoidia bacterium]
MTSGKLDGKVALITGAGSGIGAATARLMAAEGAAGAVTGIPDDLVIAVAAEITASGGSAVAIPTDVSDPKQVEAAVEQTVGAFGRLDILVPNAGVQMHREDRNLHELPEAVWDRTHDVNYKGQYHACKYGLAQMVKQGEGGVVILVASVTTLRGTTPNVSYSTGKAGLVNLARHIAVHYGGQGIRANSICPGALVRTPDHDDHPDPEGCAAGIVGKIPLGRLGTPEDIAPFITFLATDDASYASGANYVVDGGLTVT